MSIYSRIVYQRQSLILVSYIEPDISTVYNHIDWWSFKVNTYILSCWNIYIASYYNKSMYRSMEWEGTMYIHLFSDYIAIQIFGKLSCEYKLLTSHVMV